MSKVGGSDSKNTLYCSFCGKSQHEVRKLIAGPTVFICERSGLSPRRRWSARLAPDDSDEPGAIPRLPVQRG